MCLYHKDPLTAHVLHPLYDHWNIGMWEIYLGDDPEFNEYDLSERLAGNVE